jgi:photosystem II stability/assembly factor-like uncharacterized protein
MQPKKILLIIFFLIIPLVLSACSFAFGPGGGSPGVIGAKGVFKSDNKGEVWLEQNILADNPTGLSGFNVHQLAFDIFDTNILYRSSNVGLFISQDSGNIWQQINTNSISNFVLNPKTRGIIYISTANQIYKTTDNGENWQLIYTEAKPDIDIISLAISYFDTSQVYALESDGTLLLSLNWGDSWKSLYSFEQKDVKQLLINPYNSQHIYVGTSRRLYQSLDQGNSWTEILEDKAKDFPGINQYKQLFFTQPAGNLIYLSRYGIFTSRDNAQSWQPVTLISSPNSVDIQTISFNPNDNKEMYYAAGSILYHTVDAGQNWRTKVLPVPSGARASQLLINPDDSNIIYLSITQ